MSGLRDALARELYVQDMIKDEPNDKAPTKRREPYERAWDVPGGAGRQRWLNLADAVLRVLAEHGDDEQVRERVAAALWTAFREDSGFVEAVMAVVAPHLAAARQQLDQGKACHCGGFPYPDLSRLAEMDGYLQQLADETGDDDPLTFWREIRRSINKPVRDRIDEMTGRLDAPARPAGHDESGGER